MKHLREPNIKPLYQVITNTYNLLKVGWHSKVMEIV